MSQVSAGHYLLGSVGLALVRRWLTGERTELDGYVDDAGRIAAAPDQGPLAIRFDVPTLDVEAGYARWATSYDDAPNPLIRCEGPVVREWIDALPSGSALDAACGTGRHAAHLVARGHDVVGVDVTPAMLAKARARIPDAEFREGALEALPLDDQSVDLAVCALALTHVPDLVRPIAELARVLRPGGHLLVSDLHPFMTLLGGTGFFVDAEGGAGNVRTYHHSIGAYLAAFREPGLEVIACAEPSLAEEDLAALSGGMVDLAAEAFRAAWVGLPNALIWKLRRA